MPDKITRSTETFQPDDLAKIKPKGKLGWHRDVYKIDNEGAIKIKMVGPLRRALYQLRTLARWVFRQPLNERTWTILTSDGLSDLKKKFPPSSASPPAEGGLLPGVETPRPDKVDPGQQTIDTLLKLQKRWLQAHQDILELSPDLEPTRQHGVTVALQGIPDNPEALETLLGAALDDEIDRENLVYRWEDSVTELETLRGFLKTRPEAPGAIIAAEGGQSEVPELKLTKPLTDPVGILNIGNSCYMNATAQAFLASQAFLTRLKEVVNSERTDPQLPAPKKELLAALVTLANALQEGNELDIFMAADNLHKITVEKGAELGQPDLGEPQPDEALGQALLARMEGNVAQAIQSTELAQGSEEDIIMTIQAMALEACYTLPEEDRKAFIDSRARFAQRDPTPLAAVLIDLLKLDIPGAKTLRQAAPSGGDAIAPPLVSSPSPLAYLDLTIENEVEPSTLQDLVNARAKDTINDPENPWKPNNFPGQSFPTYSVTLQLPAEELPPVLTMTLNRIVADSEVDAEGRSHKNTAEVRLPEDGIIQLGEWVEGKTPTQYRIVGVVNHEGQNPRSGHYVADTYPTGKTRFHCNDNTVTREEGYAGSKNCMMIVLEKVERPAPPAGESSG